MLYWYCILSRKSGRVVGPCRGDTRAHLRIGAWIILYLLPFCLATRAVAQTTHSNLRTRTVNARLPVQPLDTLTIAPHCCLRLTPFLEKCFLPGSFPCKTAPCTSTRRGYSGLIPVSAGCISITGCCRSILLPRYAVSILRLSGGQRGKAISNLTLPLTSRPPNPGRVPASCQPVPTPVG